MSSTLSILPTGHDSLGADDHPQHRRQSGGQSAQTAESPATAAPSEHRLIIQEVGDTGTFVYTVIDRVTGQTVHQTSREDVARMGERTDYAAGALIKTRA
jgi:hypothetical protein